MDELKLIDGQMMSLEEVCLKFRPLIASLSGKLQKTAYKFGLEFDDLFSFGSEGLIKAYRKFDSEKGFKFMTYAFPLVRGEIQRRIRDYGGVVKFSRGEKSLAKEIYRSEMQDLSVAEICKRTGRKEAEVLSALAILNSPTVSLDKQLNDDDEKGINLGDHIGVNSDFSTVEVHDFLSTLQPKLRKVVTLTMNDKTQKEVGEEIGCSQVQVSRYLKQVGELYKQYLTEGETMKQIRLRIIDLIDQHGDTFEKCKGCPTCNEIMQLRKKLERDPADKYQSILAKGQDMTKSDIAFLLENDVKIETIRQFAGIPNSDFWEMMKNYGFSKNKPRKERETEMGKLEMTVEEFVDLKYVKKLPITKIAEQKGVADPTIHYWIKKHEDEIKALVGNKQTDTSEIKVSGHKTIQESIEEAFAEKSAEYDVLIEELKKQISHKDEAIEAFKNIVSLKDKEIQQLRDNFDQQEHLQAACEDVENELSSLQEETGRLQMENSFFQDANKELQHELLKLQDEYHNLDLENSYMRQLLKLWM